MAVSGEVGVNVAMKLIASYEMVPAIAVDPGPVSWNVAVVIVSGFIASVKVALAAALRATPVARFAGTVETSSGNSCCLGSSHRRIRSSL